MEAWLERNFTRYTRAKWSSESGVRRVIANNIILIIVIAFTLQEADEALLIERYDTNITQGEENHKKCIKDTPPCVPAPPPPHTHTHTYTL